jgi:hypothetical protein
MSQIRQEIAAVIRKMQARSKSSQFSPVIVIVPGREPEPPPAHLLQRLARQQMLTAARQDPRDIQPVRGYGRCKTPTYRTAVIG